MLIFRRSLTAALGSLLLLATPVRAVAEEMPFEVRVLNATEVDLSGMIGKGLAAEFGKVLEANPGLRLVHVNVSRGGYVKEAWAVADLIARRQMDTFVPRPCAGACTIVVSGGVHRYLRSGAKLGYANYDVPGKGPLSAAEWQTLYRQAFPADFVAKASEASLTDLWTPGKEELLSSGAITEIVSGETFAASRIPASTAELEAQLLEDRLYRVVKQLEPEMFAQMVAKLQRGAEQGVPVVELRKVGLQWTQALRPKYMPYADDAAVLAIVRLVVAQAEAVAKVDQKLCVAIMSGGKVPGAENAISLVPADLRAPERDLLADVLESADPTRQLPTREYTDQLQELVFQRMGPDADVLDRLAEPDLDPAAGCRAAIALYRETLALPPADSAALIKSWYLQ